MQAKTKKSQDAETRAIGAKTANVASLMIFGRFISLFISGIAFIIIARLLGPDIYGLYTLAAAYASIVISVGIGDLGISTAFNKFIGQYSGKGNKDEIEKVLSNGYVSVIISGVALTLIAFALSGLLAGRILGSPSLAYILEVASPTILLSMLFGISYNALVGFGKGTYIALIIVLQSLVQSVVSIGFILLHYGAIAPLLGLIVGYSCSILTTILILYMKFGVRFRKPSLKYMKKLLTFSYPLAIYNGLRNFTNGLSPIVLGIFATTVIVGNFGVALKTGTIISNVTDALGLAVLPMFAYTVYTKGLSKNIGKFYNYATYFTYLLITPALLFIAILAKQFSYTIFSAKYLLAPGYLSIISVGLLIWVVATYTTALLISSNKVRTILKYGLAIAATEIILILTIVPYFGGIGLTTVLYIITPTIICILMGSAARKMLRIKLEVRKLVHVVIAGLISAVFLVPAIIFIHNYVILLVVGVFLQIIIYPIVVGLVGAARKEDLKILKDVTVNLPVMGKVIGLLADYSSHFASS